MSHPEHTQEELDTLALYALGLLEGDERISLAEHLKAGCTDCEVHLREFRETAAYFGQYAGGPVEPPITLRTRILAVADIWELSSSPGPDLEPFESSLSQTGSTSASGEDERREIEPGQTGVRHIEEPSGSDGEHSGPTHSARSSSRRTGGE
jgi:hypothetical protein